MTGNFLIYIGDFFSTYESTEGNTCTHTCTHTQFCEIDGQQLKEKSARNICLKAVPAMSLDIDSYKRKNMTHNYIKTYTSCIKVI